MLKFFKLNSTLLVGLSTYIIIASASTTGGGGGTPPPPCNENTVSLTIRVNWGAIQSYTGRSPNCLLPSQMPCLPSTQTANAPNQNTLTKAIVRINIRAAAMQTCSWAKKYESRQYYVQPGNDDVIAEVPQNISIIIELSYYELCDDCTTQNAGNTRALFTSETTVPLGQIFAGSLIQLNTPAFVNGASCN